ncbi:4-hydroxy-tetrahydrodipicolinate reductase [Flexithrix dorotheae]|uniref:4-hydroxy-tetrahydrodipicolinate reductase n=1 Tax=Flexithrix dorotheae TaxID=70993 RepID=UPI000368011E|nr:4-hydroxy-tetrahydrodipicolinate reductase [Flexithrix dorotheae]
MRILLVGYGKMGKTIEKIAKDRGNEIAGIIDVDNFSDLENMKKEDADVAIEFTQPDAAFKNISTCLSKGIPVVSGTTGWLEKKSEIEMICLQNKTAFFYASNYSIGVNLFFKLNQILAGMMNRHLQYNVAMSETHHTEKKDAPSGTAITLAEGIIANLERKNNWKLEHDQQNEDDIPIQPFRKKDVPGTHTIEYNSEVDSISIQHVAHSRQGFAEGAVQAAEWLVGKEGIFGMDDLLKF